MKKKEYHFDTLQIHAGYTPDATNSRAVPIYPTTAFTFDSPEHGANLFKLDFEPDHSPYFYSRVSNPTVSVFEQRMAALEGGVAAVAVASGHSAQLVALLTMLQAGDNFVTSPYLYGGTYNQFFVTLRDLGIEVRRAVNDSAEAMEALIDEGTKLLYTENIGNPFFNIPDFERVSALARKYDIPLMVDNTFGCGGYLCQPIKHGANVVVESATKWIGGHGTVMGGVIVDGGNYDWGNGKFPKFSEPSESYKGVIFAEKFGNQAFAMRCIAEGLRDFGPCLSPWNAWQLLQGLETLSLRVQRMCDNALELARWLEEQPWVLSVNYPGLESSPYHALAKKYLQHGFGAVLTFRVKGGEEAARKLVEGLELISHVTNIGDVRTLITHPASTTHKQVAPEVQVKSGVWPDMLRLSVGLEHLEDIKNDLMNYEL